MRRCQLFISFGRIAITLGLAAVLASFVGCYSDTVDSSSTSPADVPSPPAEGESSEEPDLDSGQSELARLSPEDQASATKQKTCPVSNEALGSMGAPKKVDVKGQQVWICCDHCKESLLEKPDEFLTKLNLGAAKEETPKEETPKEETPKEVAKGDSAPAPE